MNLATQKEQTLFFNDAKIKSPDEQNEFRPFKNNARRRKQNRKDTCLSIKSLFFFGIKFPKFSFLTGLFGHLQIRKWK